MEESGRVFPSAWEDSSAAVPVSASVSSEEAMVSAPVVWELDRSTLFLEPHPAARHMPDSRKTGMIRERFIGRVSFLDLSSLYTKKRDFSTAFAEAECFLRINYKNRKV